MIAVGTYIEIGNTDIELIDGDRGKNYPHQNELRQEGDCVFLSANNVTTDGFKFDNVVYITAEKDRALRNGKIQRGDIVITTRGTVGNVAYYNQQIPYDNIRINSGMLIVRCHEQIKSEFLYYVLRGVEFQRQIKQIQTGTAQPQLPKSHFIKMKIIVPTIDVQEKIAKILRTIDEKIESNKFINKNLQAQAQAVFLHLFADNESVIPASIADVALNVTDGVHNTVHDDPDGEYLLLSCKNIKGGSLSIGTSERRINAETFEKLRRRTKLAKGDVLISSVGTVGELLLVNTEPSNYEFQRSVAMVKPNPDIVSSVYLYEALLSQKAELINAAHGAVQQCLFISDIAGFPIGIPTQDDLLTFDEVATPMFNTITANEAESIRLAALRDALLPNLMSGEIDVSDLDL